MSLHTIEALLTTAGRGGLEGVGPGLGSFTGWVVVAVVLLLLVWVGRRRSTRRHR